jgi:hypothetical protein
MSFCLLCVEGPVVELHGSGLSSVVQEAWFLEKRQESLAEISALHLPRKPEAPL